MSSGQHTYKTYESVIVLWDRLNFLVGFIKICCESFNLAFLRLNRLLNGVGCGTITGWTVTHIGWCCVRGIGSRTYFSHISEMFEDTKMRSGLYPFFHIALLTDFGSFALWMSDNLFGSAHCSTFSFAICCGVSPEGTVTVEISYYDVRLDSLSQWRE